LGNPPLSPHFLKDFGTSTSAVISNCVVSAGFWPEWDDYGILYDNRVAPLRDTILVLVTIYRHARALPLRVALFVSFGEHPLHASLHL
jgi:hypothetical protein